MLEDGEIGEDEFTTTPPTTENNNINNNNSKTSPSYDNELNTQKSKSKRNTKSRELDLNKRHKKHHHHKSTRRDNDDDEEEDEEAEEGEALNDDELNDAYNSNFDENNLNGNDDLMFNSKNDYDSRLDTNLINSTTVDSIFNLAGGDRDERDININIKKSKYPSLMSTSITSSWSTPMSKKEIESQPIQQQHQQKPKSLLDLFLTSASTINSVQTNNDIIDPVLTEKENKPNKFTQINKNLKLNQQNRPQQNTNFSNNKRKSEEEADEKLVTTESIEKKLEKKRKYIEQVKEKQKVKELKQQQQQTKEPIVCKFFQEGRCQKGAECPFSHNVPLNKKFEICKYYLNGYCAKEEKCLYMHSEFPCKFFHRKNYQTGVKMNKCLHGDACRFSHQPITNPLLLEAFEKHLAETDNNESKPNNNKTSILGSPPQQPTQQQQIQHQPIEIPSLMNISIKTPATTTVTKTSSLSPPSSPPQSLLTPANNLVNPLMTRLNPNEPKKQPLLATPPQSFINQTALMPNPLINPLMGSRIVQKNIPINNINNNIISSKPVSLFNDQDVDERAILNTKPSTLISTNIPLNLVNNNTKIMPTNDVDERSISIPSTNKSITPEEPPKDIKQDLIIKIMKSLADESGGVFAQIPKQTLTELLVKLLNSSNDSKSDGTDVIINLLTSLSSNASSNNSNVRSSFDSHTDDDKLAGLNESSSNLQIDLSMNNTKINKSKYDEYDNDDDDDDDYDLIIEGQIDDMPYKLIELDIEPSKLWFDPPQLVNTQNDPLSVDQESDPRIKYYNNVANLTNVANFQQQLIQQNQLQQQQSLQQQIQTPTSPSSSSNTNLINPLSNLLSSSASSPSGQTDSTNQSNKSINKQQQQQQQQQQTNRIADPRLLRNQNTVNTNNMSPTRSVSPLSHEQLFGKTLLQSQNDLISIQSRQLTGNSLLSSLPDLQLPTVYQKISQQYTQPQQQQQQESNTVKLSIEDYKRKLQKPSTSNYNNSNSNLNLNRTNSISSSILSSISNDYQSNSTSNSSLSSSSSTTTNNSNTPSLPSIPSYLQAPQSLHELLRNFQS